MLIRWVSNSSAAVGSVEARSAPTHTHSHTCTGRPDHARSVSFMPQSHSPAQVLIWGLRSQVWELFFCACLFVFCCLTFPPPEDTLGRWFNAAPMECGRRALLSAPVGSQRVIWGEIREVPDVRRRGRERAELSVSANCSLWQLCKANNPGTLVWVAFDVGVRSEPRLSEEMFLRVFYVFALTFLGRGWDELSSHCCRSVSKLVNLEEKKTAWIRGRYLEYLNLFSERGK